MYIHTHTHTHTLMFYDITSFMITSQLNKCHSPYLNPCA